MVRITDLHYAIGARELLKGIHWLIRPRKRLALIGPNGAGKTTLLRLLNGDIAPDAGEIQQPRGAVIGYLPQEEVSVGQGTLLECVLKGLQEMAEIGKRIAELHEALDGSAHPSEDLLEQLGTLEHRFDALGGYRAEFEARSILMGLGFEEADCHRPIGEFSGGWRMRAYLGRLLLRQPDLLLLDEPTNHLDLPSLEWLEQYLLSSSSSMVLVSHDRFFIDRLAEEIFELEEGKLTHYPGNYHFYETQKEERRLLLEKAWKAQQEEIERQKAFIERFRAKNTKATQVQSRIKMLEKMDRIELPRDPRRLSFKMTVRVPSFREVLALEHLCFRYDQKWVLSNVSMEISRGEKVALVGVNGAGKTTLTRLMAGELIPQEGSCRLGQKVVIGYYAQHQIDALDLDATIYESAASSGMHRKAQEIRNVLGVFQFSGDDIQKKIRVLSGGEKARVSLARIMLSPANFLIMDEPVNHLDARAREALEEALSKYDGTLLLISHDRYFLDKLVQKVFELKGGGMRLFSGNYSAYLSHREEEASLQILSQDKETSGARKSKDKKRKEAEFRNAFSRKSAPLRKLIEELEKRNEELSREKTEKEALMSQPTSYEDSEFFVRLGKDYARICQELDDLAGRWTEAQLAYEELAQEFSLADEPQS